MWYLIHIFDRNGGDVIVSTAVVSVRESGKEGIMYIVYINGKKFAGEQDRSLFPAWDGLRANAQNIRVRC